MASAAKERIFQEKLIAHLQQRAAEHGAKSIWARMLAKAQAKADADAKVAK